jgi:inhibitor of cysteine peptidase
MKRNYLLLKILILAALAACNPAVSDTPPTELAPEDAPVSSDDPTPIPVTTETADSENMIIGEAQVQAIDILIMESFPVQISVQVTGYLSDGCTTLGVIETTQADDTFLVTITTHRPADAVCTQQLVDFEENISLDVQGLPAGTYTVDVNGVTDTFTLSVDNVLPDQESGIELPDSEMAELIRLTLERALIAQEIPDYTLLTADREEIVLSTENINAALVPELEGVNLVVLAPEEIQAKANEEGDFLYLKFEEITAISPTEARVALNNIWMRAEDSEVAYLSGGGFLIEYTKTADGWQGEITSSWIS